jgi:hypothetical protein
MKLKDACKKEKDKADAMKNINGTNGIHGFRNTHVKTDIQKQFRKKGIKINT